MTAIAEVIRQLPVFYGAISILDNLITVTGCAFVTVALFRLTLRKKVWNFLLAALLCIVLGAGDHYMLSVEGSLLDLVWTTLTMLLPFVCMALLFRRPGLWKAMLVSFGYTFVDALRYFVLMAFFRYDFDNPNEPLEMLVGFLVNVAVFLAAFILLTRYTKKRVIALNVTRNASILFLLVVFTVAIFVTSMLLFTSSNTATRQLEFAFVLLNIPMLAATIAFALYTISQIRVQSERYREQLSMQVQQFEWMEQMNDDLRVFCHDFPKKMRPLILFIDEDKPAEARAMAQQFTDFVATRGERFHTGNYRFDTVLFCEQQLALKDDIRFDVPFDTVFPREGIDPDDIYTIFPNALDNAIEACRKVEGERVVSVHARISNGTVYVTIRNPVAGTVSEKNGELQTTKADKEHHGLGLRSIKKAAAKYGDNNVAYSVENGWFTLRLHLRFEPTE
jgi:hypothetical protein